MNNMEKNMNSGADEQRWVTIDEAFPNRQKDLEEAEARYNQEIAEAEAAGKEPFSFEKLSRIYYPDNRLGEERDTSDLEADYKRKYYSQDEFNTVEEFAEAIKYSEAQGDS
ncbi:MAG: hypothetical protein LBQ02_00430 [Candidatus Nomurabacteria bacterium]|jgi:regulator of protease activity HflC (stomatin/prohibitin superfamily)|nr:hypothetical protein [Candidatus Nomurabacteria bacterium]